MTGKEYIEQLKTIAKNRCGSEVRWQINNHFSAIKSTTYKERKMQIEEVYLTKEQAIEYAQAILNAYGLDHKAEGYQVAQR
jgi:endonuclease I